MRYTLTYPFKTVMFGALLSLGANPESQPIQKSKAPNDKNELCRAPLRYGAKHQALIIPVPSEEEC
jgi:hypothetical protein